MRGDRSADKGIGIDADEVLTVFQRFTRGQRARLHRVDGTGIGLSIAQSIVVAHEGRIDTEQRTVRGHDGSHPAVLIVIKFYLLNLY